MRFGRNSGITVKRELWSELFKPKVDKSIRLESVAHGGQIIISSAVRELVLDSINPESELIESGQIFLKSLERPETVFQLKAPGLAEMFPPLRSIETQLKTQSGAMADYHNLKGSSEKARDCYTKALSIMKQGEDRQNLSLGYLYSGAATRCMGDLQSAVSERLSFELGFVYGIERSLIDGTKIESFSF